MPKARKLFNYALTKCPFIVGPLASFASWPKDTYQCSVLRAHCKGRLLRMTKRVKFSHSLNGFMLTLKAGGAECCDFIGVHSHTSGDKSLASAIAGRFDSMAGSMLQHAGPYL